HLQSDAFFSGRYRSKVIQVDSSKTGAEEEEMVRRLLAVESVDEPTEIVIHVNMLKEGWDVTNLYTIVPLRAANARTLVEQSIGRGLRLPYGKRTGVAAVDRLNIIAHDRFQEIIDDANRPDSPIRLKQVVLEAPDAEGAGPPQSVMVRPNWESMLTDASDDGAAPRIGSGTRPAGTPVVAPLFATEPERQAAKLAMEAAAAYELRPQDAPTRQALLTPEVQASIAEAVKAKLPPQQASLLTGADAAPEIDLADVVRKAMDVLVRQTIDIPRIAVVPKGEVTSGFKPFALDVSGMRLQPKDRSLVGQTLRTHEQFTLSAQTGRAERRLEDYVVHALIDFDDIDYAVHAALLYDLAGQVVAHLRSYLANETEVRNVLDLDRKLIAANIYAQMMGHFYETATEYAVEVRRGFTALKAPTYSVAAGQAVRDYRNTVDEPSRIKQMLFGNFTRCLYPVQKFDSDTERRFAVILERDAEKWFKPAKGQFQIFYKLGAEHPEYVPDFVAETQHHLLLCETKARNEMEAEDVKAKAEAGALWCLHASEHAAKIGAKSWKYLLIPHEQVTEDKRLLDFLQFEGGKK
ncbi:MAG: type III restriction endonuclease subunit R, partial [Ramlibacter sp.]